MPNIIDFDTIDDVKEVLVNPEGWKQPLYVEYGVRLDYDVPCYFWRVKGTEHTFKIPVTRFYYLSSGDYGSHFKEALENFRADYLEWEAEGFAKAPWQGEYREQYERFIELRNGSQASQDKENKH